MADNKKIKKKIIHKSPLSQREEEGSDSDHSLNLKNLKFPVENSTADQAFFVRDSRSPPHAKYEARTSEGESAYAQDKDFESGSNEEDDVADFPLEQQLYLDDEDQIVAADDETPHNRSMEENVDPGDEAQMKQPRSTHHKAEFALASQPFKAIIHSSANLHHTGVGNVPQIQIDPHTINLQKQSIDAGLAIGVHYNAALPATLHASNSPLQQTHMKQLANHHKVFGKASVANKPGQLSKLDKSQQIRNSYNRFMAGQLAHGTSSQRPSGAQTGQLLNNGAQLTNNPFTDAMVTTQAAAQHGRVGRRANVKSKNTAVRSKTVKPQTEPVATTTVSAPKNQASSTHLGGSITANTKCVDLLVIGAGPAALGFLVSAVKQQRFGELLQEDGIAILDNGISLGGGMLCEYGINSNTSANSFLKCIFRRSKEKKDASNLIQAGTSTAAVVGQAITPANQNGKELTAKPHKRRQKSVGKERQGWGQPNNAMKHGLEITGKSRERQMSPILAQKWMPSSQAAQLAKQTKDGSSNPQLKADLAVAQPLGLQTKQQAQTYQVGQPQDPDMEELPQCQTSSGEHNEVLSEHEEDAAVDMAIMILNGQEPPNNQVMSQTQLADANLLQEDKQGKRAVRRRKSRDESTVGGRNGKKQHQTSQNRNQATMKITGAKPNFTKAAQAGIIVYGQANQQHAQTGPTAKYLANQAKARAVEAAGGESKVWSQEDVLTPFKDIFPSNISQLFRRLAKNIVPLSLVGHLLNYVGNHLLHYAYKSAGKRIYMPKHKAVSIQLMGNGEIVTQVLKTDYTIITDPSNSPPTFSVVEGKQSIVYFRSKAVVIAGGAHQGIDPRIGNEWFPGLDLQNLVASDSFLKKAEYLRQIQRLKDLQASRASQGKRVKVVIIGGSHSGFSCAWLLLNGPAMYSRCFKTLSKHECAEIDAKELQNAAQKQLGTTNSGKKVPYAFRKTIKNCIPCCTCGNSVLIANQKLSAQNAGGNTQNQRYMDELRSQSKAGQRVQRGLSVATRELSPVAKNGRLLSKTVKQKKDLVSLKQQLPPQDSKAIQSAVSPDAKPAKVIEQYGEQADTLTCTCLCKCLGYFRYDEWPNLDSQDNVLELPDFGEADIKILYRDRIKVFFKTTKNAIEAGYEDFDVGQRSNKKKDGYVYSFTGLRGDAKQLYLDVTQGKEKRVAFVKAETPELQREHVEQADLVIWACGYQSNAIKIHDVNKKELVLSQKVPGTQYDVDGKNRVMLADGNVLNKVFACGVGFPVRTKDGGAGNLDPSKNPRADSFSLYMHTVGEVLLKSLLPKKKIAAIVSHKEAANPYLKAATYEQIMKDKQHKNKKPLLQQVSTKKDKSASKIGFLANPGSRLQKGSLQIDMIAEPNANQQHQEFIGVYSNYLQTAKQGNRIQVKTKPSGLNSDLEDLSGFGVINTHSSNTNCISYRPENDQVEIPAAGEALLQKSNFAEAALLRNSGNLSANDSCKVQKVIKFPEIRRDAPFINSLPDKNSKQYNSICQESQQQQQVQSLTSLTTLDQEKQPAKPDYLAHQEMLIDDLNDRDHSLSANILPSQIVIPQNDIPVFESHQTTDHQEQLQATVVESNKAMMDRSLAVVSQSSRNAQAMTPSITGKSPLLLQKKQQMIIQKTKEPLSTHAIIQQTAQQPNYQQVATVNNLKPTKTGSLAKGSKAGSSYHVTKAGGSSSGTQDLFKKHHNQLLTAVDKSPYMQFGVQNAQQSNQVAHHGEKMFHNNRNHNISKTSKAAGAVIKKRNHTEQGVSSYSTAIKEGSSYLGGSGHTKQQNVSRHPSGKEAISSMIQQSQKAFSDRESNMHARYKAVHGAGMQHKSGLQKDAVVRKEHITSVDVTSGKSTHNLLSKTQSNDKPGASNQATTIHQVELQEAFGHHKSHQLNDQGVYSVKSLASNSDLFPPIGNKGQQDCSLSSTITGGSSKMKHKRIVSSSKAQNYQLQNDSVRSLHMSSQNVASVSHQNIAASSLKQRNASISAQKAAAAINQHKGLVFTPQVVGNSAAPGNRVRHHNLTGGGYMATGRTAAQNTATAAGMQSKSGTPGVTSSSLPAGHSTHKRTGSNHTRSSFVSKKKTLQTMQSIESQVTTHLTQKGIILPASGEENIGVESQEVFAEQEAREKSSTYLIVGVSQPQPDLNEMHVQDISLKLPEPTIVLKNDQDDLDQLIEEQDYEQLLPDSDRTTILEVAQDDPADDVLNQELESDAVPEPQPSQTPHVTTLTGGNNHFKNAKKMSQNTAATGAYGEIIAAAHQETKAIKSPHLRQSSEFQPPKRGDVDQLGNSSSPFNHAVANHQNIDKKIQSTEKLKQVASSKRQDQTVNRQVVNKAQQQQHQLNKSPTPHRSNLTGTVAGKFSSHASQIQANLQRQGRRNGGAVSATDLQGMEKTPRAVGAKGRSSIGATSNKRSMETAGFLLDRNEIDKKQSAGPTADNKLQMIQPYLEHPATSSHLVGVAAPSIMNQLTNVNNNSHAAPSTIGHKKPSQSKRVSNANTGHKSTHQQKQYAQGKPLQNTWAEGSPEKPMASDYITDKAQVLSNPVAARLLSTPTHNNHDLSVDKHQISSFSAAQKIINNDDSDNAGGHEVSCERVVRDVKQLRPTKQPTTEACNSSGYQKSSVVSGFFVHKTIKDLAISSQPDEQLLLKDAKIARSESSEAMQTHIKAIKKEVQAKVANLSPVLKKRGQSKVNLGVSYTSKTMHGKDVGQLNTSKYRSPIRTTLKSAATSSVAKEVHPSANVRHQVTSSRENNQNSSSSAYGKEQQINGGTPGQPLRQSQTLRQYQGQPAFSSSMRSPKSGGRRNMYQQPHQQQPSSDSAHRMRPESIQQVSGAGAVAAGAGGSTNKAAIGLTSSSHQAVTHVQVKREIQQMNSIRNSKK